MKKLLFILVIVSLFATPVSAAEKTNVLLLFDASGSMTEEFGGKPRIDAAKEAVSQFVNGVGSTVNLGLRGYAHVKHAGNKEAACSETEFLNDFGTAPSKIVEDVNKFQAVGSYTPTAYALEQAATDFDPEKENALILLTDGKETCDGDPVAAARALCMAGVNVQTHVIGLNVDEETRIELQSVADAGCGNYYDTDDAEALAETLSDIVKDAIPKGGEDETHPRVEGGDSFATATQLPLGTYQLENHLKPGEKSYFKVPLVMDQQVRFTVRNLNVPIGHDGSDFVVLSDYLQPKTELFFFTPGEEKIVSISSQGDYAEAVKHITALKNGFGERNDSTGYRYHKDAPDSSFVYLRLGTGGGEHGTHRDTVLEVGDPAMAPAAAGPVKDGGTTDSPASPSSVDDGESADPVQTDSTENVDSVSQERSSSSDTKSSSKGKMILWIVLALVILILVLLFIRRR